MIDAMEKVNPSMKLITGMIAVILLAFQYIIPLNISVFAVSMLLVIFFSKVKFKRLLFILIPALFAAFGLFLMGLYYAKNNSVTAQELSDLSALPYMLRSSMSQNFKTALQLSTRILAFAGIGTLFALTTDGEHLTASLIHQCKLKPKFAYGVLAAVNLMPNISSELQKVKLAYNVRGFKVSSLSFKVIFTMMVNSIRWSESVAMAMESKGFDSKSERTYYLAPKIHFYDWIYFSAWILFIVLQMIFVR